MAPMMARQGSGATQKCCIIVIFQTFAADARALMHLAAEIIALRMSIDDRTGGER